MVAEHSVRSAASVHTTGSLAFLNPTTRYLLAPSLALEDGGAKTAAASGSEGIVGTPAAADIAAAAAAKQREQQRQRRAAIYHVWRSRDNRKGRHSALVTPEVLAKIETASVPRATDTFAETWRGVVKMFTRFPVWDISYDVAVVFTLGSVVWVLNGSFVWLPLAAPWTEFPGEVDLGGGVTAFVGATIFEFGSVLLMLEAVNENRSDCFGWALEEVVESHRLRLHRSEEKCRHHHHVRRSLLPSRSTIPDPDPEASSSDQKGAAQIDEPKPRQRRWSWCPTWHELTSHYFRDVGFLACLSQMLGATIFWIASFTGLPPILDALSTPAANGVFWLPQVVGGTGFIVSSLLFMIEVQDRWYIPAPRLLGWHIGLWNLVGAIGFTLCGALGFASENPAVEYALTLSTYIGSWAFLVSFVVAKCHANKPP
ncbi:hypothetical protein B0T22DRAFT_465724 [Podospora appendiculata]|uniref:Integral membrane protein n=1 Tax=Podospora appendiculata TaxID=314037 RepID=A0AAE1CAB7_9PEZI|nr:hypothetical protein B0T22DRAFT_465724 [Podospora appendiculata]